MALHGGQQAAQERSNRGERLRVSRKEPYLVNRSLYAFLQGHPHAPITLDSCPRARVVVTPTGAAPAREPRQEAGVGPSPSNEAGLH